MSPTAAVDSVFTRTGAVVAANGDYSIGQITGAPVSVFGRTGAVVAANGDYTAAQVTGAAALASPTFTGTVTVPAAAAVTSAPRLNQVSPVLTIVSGALPTVQLVSGAGVR
jgi:hypothetical protein